MKKEIIKNNILSCIYNAHNQEDIVPCVEQYLSDNCKDYKMLNKLLSLENIIDIKNEIINICEVRGFDLRFICLKMWWNKNFPLNKIGIFIMPSIYQKPNSENIKSLLNISKRVENMDLANYFSYCVTQIVNRNLDAWESLIVKLFMTENKWINYASANILLLLSQRDSNYITTIINILRKIAFPFDEQTMNRLEIVFDNISYHQGISEINVKNVYSQLNSQNKLK